MSAGPSHTLHESAMCLTTPQRICTRLCSLLIDQEEQSRSGALLGADVTTQETQYSSPGISCLAGVSIFYEYQTTLLTFSDPFG